MNQNSNLFESLKEAFSLTEVVSFKEFVTSPDFCNDQYMYEFWINEGMNIPELCSELLLDGSLGGGKSYFGSYYLAYRVYKLFCNGDPRPIFGLAPGTPMYCLYFSTNITTAKRSGFQYLMGVFSNCKWFKNNMPVDKSIESIIRFPNNFEICYASSESHQIGLNIWAFILDESNFRQWVGNGVAEEYNEVTQLYQQLTDRLTSRYSTPDGVNALSILISSASYQSSFTEKRKAVIKADRNGHIITAVNYKIKPWQYSSEMFEVFVGAGAVEPAIIKDEEHKQALLKQSLLEGIGKEEDLIIQVPCSIKKTFEINIRLALQNHCGVPTNIQGRFMNNLKPLYDSFVIDSPPIFSSEVLEASTADDTELIEFLIPENIEFSYRPHSVFMDLSVQHDTGTLCCYRYDGNQDGVDIHSKVFLLKIEPPAYPHQTKISKVQNLVISLAQYINIVAFGSDQYQSTQVRQEVQSALGLEDIRVSIDSSDIPHLHYTRGLIDGKIRNREDAKLIKEVEEAEHDLKRRRVLKSKNSSDDTFQAEVGAYFLSDTFGRNTGTAEGLYPKRTNLIGGQSMTKILKDLGYTN